MPAELIRNDAIPELAAGLDAKMVGVLRRIQKTGFILNDSDVDEETADVLRRLTERGLVDAGYEGPTHAKPSLWVSNGNGSRVLRYKTGIRAGPHYEIPAAELAAWLREQGEDRWWNVDGDPLLTGRMTFPCPASELAEELCRIGRSLLVQAKKEDGAATGQRVGKEKLNALVSHFGESLHGASPGETPPWSADRLLYLCWKGSPHEWLLAEDSETTEQMRVQDRGQGRDAVPRRRE